MLCRRRRTRSSCPLGIDRNKDQNAEDTRAPQRRRPEQLEGEGFTQIVRRWQYLLIGTADEDDGHTLAQRLQGELPAGARIEVEPGGGLAWQLSPRNPFAVFGGFAS